MRIVPLSEANEPLLSPDLIWDGISGDIAISPLSDPDNPGGLVSRDALKTAVLICLMTDIRVDPVELRDGDENKGWPGDGFDLETGDVPMGSRLWQLRRSSLYEGIELDAQDWARAALQTLIDQGVFVRFDVEAVRVPQANRLTLIVTGFGRDRADPTYQDRFAVLWEQMDAV
ncbi:phage GP46 family protein [Aurantimonas coralicida]|uniref:phage GP46 family protein n=1 Tax=Aurantimonas coralicida TaxID=182270 RepID=UPI001D19213A|nr:phage GP46 family protein [Aurantimonas coralicida]MCC4296289.1 phage GP46 family protein [Aurantimonas coralicida]